MDPTSGWIFQIIYLASLHDIGFEQDQGQLRSN